MKSFALAVVAIYNDETLVGFNVFSFQARNAGEAKLKAIENFKKQLKDEINVKIEDCTFLANTLELE